MTTKLFIAGTARRRAGGWTYTLETADQAVRTDTGSAWDVTTPRMDLAALVHGLAAVSPGAVEVVLTSEALVRTATEWMPAWRAKGAKALASPQAGTSGWRSLSDARGRGR